MTTHPQPYSVLPQSESPTDNVVISQPPPSPSEPSTPESPTLSRVLHPLPNSPETGSTDNPSVSAPNLPPERSSNIHINHPSTPIHTEPLLTTVTNDVRETLPPLHQSSSIRKRDTPSSSVTTPNYPTQENNHAEEPHPKRLKPDQHHQPSVSSPFTTESTPITHPESEGQPSPEKMQIDTTNVDVSTTNPTQNPKPLSLAVAPTTAASLPLLRSIPVLPDSKPHTSHVQTQEPMSPNLKHAIIESNINQHQHPSANHQPNLANTQRKKKTVSWASEDKLVDVHLIDNRMELVRSWDVDFHVTLPFAPNTLQMFQQALKEQDAAKRNEGHSDGKGTISLSFRSMPKLTSFEEARKREHDMEQERARQVREQLKERLNAMAPSATWKPPSAIVLPAECRMEEESVEKQDVVGADYLEKSADSDARSPPSPPHQSNESYDTPRHTTPKVPLIPLSDRFAQNGDTDFESVPAASHIDSQQYLRPEARQDRFKENADRITSNEDNGTDFKSSPDSFSKDYNYPDTQNGAVGSSGLNLRSDSDNNSRDQYMQNDYSDANPTPSPSQAHAVQHLLSALQSSGLLKQGNGLVNPKNNTTDYGRNSNSDNARGASDGSYSEAQQGDNPDTTNHDGSDSYEDETRENDQPQKEGGVQGQGMSTPEGAMPPPMMGHSMGAPFPGGIQQPGMMDMMHFPGAMGHPPMGMPPMGLPPPAGIPAGAMPPPPIGMPPPPLGMLQMLGVPVPLMSIPPGMQMADGGQGQSTSNNNSHPGNNSGRNGAGRGVETISRPKQKPLKQRKRCKYFGTKQGCRDGSSCMFAHN